MRALLCLAVFVGVGSLARAQTQLLTRVGDAANDQYGSAVAFVGDVDADGVQDYAVGAPGSGFGGSPPGKVRVYSGRTLQVLFTWNGGAAKDRFGNSIAGAGDINGDGHDDVLIGAPQDPQFNPGGYAVVRSGATGAVIRTLQGAGGEDFGYAVAGGGFVDGDSVPDMLIGAPYQDASGSWRGRVYVISGASGTVIRTNDGALDYGTFGATVAFLGDVNGDGRDDYAAGAPGIQLTYSPPLVSAFDGATGALLWTDNNTNYSDQFGWALAPISDISGDGVRDLLVGAMQDAGIGCACSGKGYVRAINGLTGAQLYQITNTTGLYTGFGWAVTAIGDLNGNGYEDFAASRPGSEGCGGTFAHEVQIRDGQNGALILLLATPVGSQQFGSSLAFGDANGDGLRDLVCGAPCSTTNGAFAGSIYVYTIVRAPIAYCDSETNTLGCTPAIAGVGTASATSASAFDVRAINLLNHKSGLLFYSFKPRETPYQGGHMCVVGPTQRTPIQSSGGTAPPASDCSGVFSFDFNARIQSSVDPLLIVGEEVFAQYWSRDPADHSTTNLSDALAFYINP